MFFIVDRSLIDEAIANNQRAQSFVTDIIMSLRDGSHLIRIDIEIVDLILDKLIKDELPRNILNEYRDRAVDLASPLPGITEGRLLLWNHKKNKPQDTDRLRQGITLYEINLQEYPSLKILNSTALWGEGQDDCTFLRKIAEAYMDEKDCNVDICLESMPGGGGTLGSNLKASVDRKNRFHIAISDNDKHFDDNEIGVENYLFPTDNEIKHLGQTAKNLLTEYPNLDLKLVGAYIYQYTSELENLIPWSIVSAINPTPFSQSVYNHIVDKSFFDLKKGMNINDLMSSPEFFDYWYPMLSSEANLKASVDQMINNYRQLKQAYETETDELRKLKAQKTFDDFKKTIILKGKKFLKDLISSTSHFNSLGRKDIYAKLTSRQKAEWDEIGAQILTYGAAGRAFLN